jgi:hypothetical protein
MPAPAQLPEWNTGGANRTDPPGGTKISGLTVNGPIISSYFNWFMWTVYKWAEYLSVFTTEALTWTALQTFSARIIANWAGGIQPAITGNNTNASVSSVAVRGDSVNGLGVDGLGGYVGVGGASSSAGVAGSAGVWGTASNANTPGVLGTHNTAGGKAIRAVATGSGVVGLSADVSGGTGASIAIETSGGVWSVNASTPSGIAGSAAVRGRGGISGVDGAPTVSSGGVGLRGTGDGTGAGVAGTGGGNSGPGVFGQGGGANGNGLTATGGTGGGVGAVFGRGDGLTSQTALEVVGNISLAAAADPAGNASIPNLIHRKNLIRGWVLMTLNNTTTPTILDRMGVASVSQITAGNGVVTVTLAQNMASATFGVFAFANPSISNARTTRARSVTNATAEIEVYDPSAPTVVLTAANTNNVVLLVVFLGAQ